MVKFNKQLTTNVDDVVEKDDSPVSLLVGTHEAEVTLESTVEYPQNISLPHDLLIHIIALAQRTQQPTP